MGTLSQKNKPTTRLNVKRIVFFTLIIGASVSTTLFLILGTGGALVIPKDSAAAPPPPGANNNNNTVTVAPRGPGGVGTIDGTSSLKIWYRTDAGMTVQNAHISAWENSAGIPELDLVQTAGNMPAVVNNAVNGHPEVSFTSNAHWLMTAQGSLTTSNFVTNQASTFVVNKADIMNQYSSLYTTHPLIGNSRFSNHLPWGGNVYYDIGTCCSPNARLQINSVSGVTNYNIWAYDAKQSSGKQLYQNGTLLQSRPNVSNYTSHNTQRFRIGRNYKGDVTEVIVFKEKINTSERYIVENYLSAKFNIALAEHDLYEHDNTVGNLNGVGNYKYNIAGIGRISGSDLHDDSQGTGIIRINNPQDLGNDEFLFWAHDKPAATFTSTTNLPAQITHKMERTWKVSELNLNQGAIDVGAIDMTFDLTGLGCDTNTLYLLIDTDQDGSFTDETRIGGSSNDSGELFTFAGVADIEDEVVFTLGLGPIASLPIELSEFSATLIDNEYVAVQWTTESEKNNDYFTIEKSTDGKNFEEIGTVGGAGNTTQKRYYSFEDNDLIAGISYYRLKQTDYDGQNETFDPQSVEWEPEAGGLEIVSIGPNPFTDRFTLRYSTTFSSNIEFSILNMGGTLVHSETLIAHDGKNEVVFENGYDLRPGIYIVTLQDASGNRVTQKVIKK